MADERTGPSASCHLSAAGLPSRVDEIRIKSRAAGDQAEPSRDPAQKKRKVPGLDPLAGWSPCNVAKSEFEAEGGHAPSQAARVSPECDASAKKQKLEGAAADAVVDPSPSETTEDKPAASGAGDKGQQGDGKAGTPWEKHHVKAGDDTPQPVGTAYWYNKVTLESRWDEPLATDEREDTAPRDEQETTTTVAFAAAAAAASAATSFGARTRQNTSGRYWSSDEHARFVEGLRIHKRDWNKVAEHVGTRTKRQVRSHLQKYALHVKRGTLKAPEDVAGVLPPSRKFVPAAVTAVVTSLVNKTCAPYERGEVAALAARIKARAREQSRSEMRTESDLKRWRDRELQRSGIFSSAADDHQQQRLKRSPAPAPSPGPFGGSSRVGLVGVSGSVTAGLSAEQLAVLSGTAGGGELGGLGGGAGGAGADGGGLHYVASWLDEEPGQFNRPTAGGKVPTTAHREALQGLQADFPDTGVLGIVWHDSGAVGPLNSLRVDRVRPGSIAERKGVRADMWLEALQFPNLRSDGGSDGGSDGDGSSDGGKAVGAIQQEPADDKSMSTM
eukprot:COSAG06_NODE_8308_length_2207_cov_1.693548_1_plen_556_part_01